MSALIDIIKILVGGGLSSGIINALLITNIAYMIIHNLKIQNEIDKNKRRIRGILCVFL